MKSIIRDLGLMEDSILEDYQKKRMKWRPPNKNYESKYEKELDLLNLMPRINLEQEKGKTG